MDHGRAWSLSHDLPRFNRRRFGQLLGLSLGGCATLGGGSPDRTGERIGGVEVGQPAPNLKLVGMGSKTTSLQGFQGHVVLLDIWVSWCEPCKVELPMLDDIAQRLQSRNVVVVAVSVDQEASNAKQFLTSRKRWSIRFFHDPAGEVAERLAPPKIPTSYAIDRQGIVRMVNAGFQAEGAPRIEQQLLALTS